MSDFCITIWSQWNTYHFSSSAMFWIRLASAQLLLEYEQPLLLFAFGTYSSSALAGSGEAKPSPRYCTLEA